MRALSKIAGTFVLVTLGAASASADDTCATFFWTGNYRAPMERYRPSYLVGEGLEDVGMDHIVGSRIRDKWSVQAGNCFSSANSYGYFFHQSFETINCVENESCFPGTRYKTLSEKLTDVKSVIEYLSIASSNGVYQSSLNKAKTGSFVVVSAMENAKSSMVTFYSHLTTQYQTMIDKLSLVVNIALPPSLRTQVMDEVCSPSNVTNMEGLLDACYDEGTYCDLYDLYDAINACSGYVNGDALGQLLPQLSTLRTRMVASKAQLVAEKDAIESLWAEIQALR